MNAYFIFAIVLTAAYIIYYAVVIVHDLYGKKTEEKSNVEVFDVPDSTEEDVGSVAVTENEHGFSVGEENYDTAADALPQSETPDEEQAQAKTSFNERVAKVEAELEETDSFLSDPMNEEELYKCMMAHTSVDNKVAVQVIPTKTEL